MLFRRVRATGFVSILKDLRRPRAHLFDELYLSQQHFFSAKASYTPAWYPCTAGGCTVTKHVRWSLSCHRLTASLHVIGQRGQPEDQRLLLCSGVVVTDKQAASTVSKLHVCLFRNLHIYMWSVAVAQPSLINTGSSPATSCSLAWPQADNSQSKHQRVGKERCIFITAKQH